MSYNKDNSITMAIIPKTITINCTILNKMPDVFTVDIDKMWNLKL